MTPETATPTTVTPKTAFLWCFAVALLGIVASTMYSAVERSGTTTTQIVRAVIFLVLGAGPILPYYLFVRRKLHESVADVPESSIDAVYYLGFLITLMSLLASVILYGVYNLGNAKNASINVVFIAISFGLSLAATAAALLGRVDLVQDRDALLAPKDVKDVLADRIHELDATYRHLSSVMSDASTGFEQNLAAANTALARRVDGALTDAVAGAAGKLKDFVEAATSEAVASQQAIRDASAAAEKAMSANTEALFNQMTRVVDQVRTSLEQFVSSAALEKPAQAMAAAVTGVTASLADASARLSDVSKSFTLLDGRAGVAAKNVDQLGSSVQGASASAAAMGDALSRFSTGSNAIDFEPVRAAFARLSDTVQRLDSISGDAEQRYAKTSAGATRAIDAHVEDLKRATEMLSDAFVTVSRELARATALLAEPSR